MKMDIFSGKKRNSEILVRENFFRTPKLGARSPPLVSMLSNFAKMTFRLYVCKLYVNLGSVRQKRADKLCEHWCPLYHQSSVEEEISLWHSQVAIQCLEMLGNDKSFHLVALFLYFFRISR